MIYFHHVAVNLKISPAMTSFVTSNDHLCHFRDILDDSAFIQSLIALSSKPNIYKPTEMSPTLCPRVPSLPCPATCATSCSPSTPQPHFLLNGTIDRKGTTVYSENRPQIQSTLQSQHAPAHVNEAIMMNTLQNLMMEVIRGELILTAHPRSISLPPFSRR